MSTCPSRETKIPTSTSSPAAAATTTQTTDAPRKQDTGSRRAAFAFASDGSAAANFGFQKKDIILVINGQKVTDPKTLNQLAQEQRHLWRITINRDGQQISTILGG